MAEILDLIAKVSWETNEKELQNVNKELAKEDKLLEELRQKGARLEDQMLKTNDPKKLKVYNAELQQTKKNADSIIESQKKQVDLTKKLQVEQKKLVDELRKTNDPNAVKGLLQNLYKVENQMSAMTKTTQTFSNKLGGIGSSFLQGIGIGGGMQIFDQIIGGIGNVFAKANQEFEDAELSQARFFQTLKNIGQEGLFDELSQMSNKLAISYQNLFDNDDITNGQIKFIEGTRVTKSELEKLIPVAIELAGKLGTDVTTASEMLVNAIIGRTSPELKRLGLDMKGAGDETERVNRITGDFATLLTGSVSSALETTTGKTQQLNQEIANLEEELGRKIAPIKKKWLELQNTLLSGVSSLFESDVDNAKKQIELQADLYKRRIQNTSLEREISIETKKRIQGQIDYILQATKANDLLIKQEKERGNVTEKTFQAKKGNELLIIGLQERYGRLKVINEVLAKKEVEKQKSINANAGQDEEEKQVVKKATTLKKAVEKASKEEPIKLTYKLESDDLNKMADDLAKDIELVRKKAFENLDKLNAEQVLDIAPTSDAEAQKLAEDIANRKKVLSEVEKKSNEERIKEVNELVDSYSQLANSVQSIISLEQQKNDKLIELQQDRVEATKKQSDKSLKIEQDRLDELTAKREKYERAQRVIDASVIVANQAVAISGAVASIASQKNPILIGAQVLAIIAGITASIGAIRSINAGFKEGGYTGDGDPSEESNQLGRKSYKYHKGEYVMDAPLTSKHKSFFEGIHKRDLMINEMRNGAYLVAPRGIDTDAIVNAHYTIKNDNNNASLVYEIQGMRNELSKIKMNVTNTFDANGFGQEVGAQIVKANLINKLRG